MIGIAPSRDDLLGDGEQVEGSAREGVEPRYGQHVAGGKGVAHSAKLNTPLRHKLRAKSRSSRPACS
jgi:hypothetical protein